MAARSSSQTPLQQVLEEVVESKFREVFNSFLVEAGNAITSLHIFYAQWRKEVGPNRMFLSNTWTRCKPGAAMYQGLISKAVSFPRSGPQNKENHNEICKEWALEAATKAREGFIQKNVAKISKILEAKGNLSQAVMTAASPGRNFGGELSFSFEDGSSFVVCNSTEWVVNTNGTFFNRFPTTFHDVILPNGKKVRKASEKKMLTEFVGA